MVRTYPRSSMITPLPSRREPSVALLRASGSARALTLTTDPSRSSACFSLMTLGFGCGVCASSGSAASAAQRNPDTTSRFRKRFIMSSRHVTAYLEPTRKPLSGVLDKHSHDLAPAQGLISPSVRLRCQLRLLRQAALPRLRRVL